MRLFSESARLPKKCTKHPKSTHLSVPLGGAGILFRSVNGLNCMAIKQLSIIKLWTYILQLRLYISLKCI